MNFALLVPLIASVVALLFVVYLVKDVLSYDRGNKEMVAISDAVQEGARAFLRREYTYIAIFVVVLFIVK